VDIAQKFGQANTDIIAQIHKVSPGIPILVYSQCPELAYAIPCMQAGAVGYLEHRQSIDLLISALDKVSQGKTHFSDNVLTLINIDTKLTHREKTVYMMLGQGYSTKKIASELGISAKTVVVHRSRIKDKLGIDYTLQLLAAIYVYTNHLPPEEAWNGIQNPLDLTPSQLQVFEMFGDPIYRNEGPKRIARVLKKSAKNVESCISGAKKRLGIDSLQKYIVLAALYHAGLVPEEFNKIEGLK